MEVFAIAIIGGKREREAFDVLRRNARDITTVVKKFEDLIFTYFSEQDLDRANVLGRELSELETKADKGRRDFLRILNEGAFLPAFRGDLAWLAERLDRVADTAEGAMRAILLREKLFTALAKAGRKSKKIKEWRSRFVKMAKLTTQTVELLQGSVEALGTNIDVALRKAAEVDKLEHEVDIIEQGLTNDLYELEALFDPLSVVQLADIIRRFGNISDRAEDMSDSIAIMAMTLTA